MINKTNLVLLIALNFIFDYLSRMILKTNAFFVSSLAEELTQNQINNLINIQQKWQWLGNILIPVLLLIKISLIATTINIGCFIFNKEMSFKTLFNIVVKAEFVFLLVIICKTLWFYAFQTDYTFEDLQYFYPLSSINIVGYRNLQTWFVYPLQAFNLFEVAYWLILSYLLGKELKTTTDKGLGIIASSYGVSLIIWVVAIMFFTLNAS